MKKCIFIVLVALISCKSVWKEPDVETTENNAPRVVSVAFSDTATVVEMEKEVGYGFLVGSGSMLVTETMKAATLRWKEGVPKVNGLHSTAKVRFRLGFDTIGKGIKRFDFVEGSGEKDYRIWGIRKKGTSLVEHKYEPMRKEIVGDDLVFLKEVLSRHTGKVIMLQMLDQHDSKEGLESMMKTISVRQRFANDPRVGFVTIGRPDGKEYKADTARAVLFEGNPIYLEFISPEEYERLANLLKPYMPNDHVLCLDQTLKILTPGLYYQSPQHFEIQLESLTKSRNLQ